MAIIKIKIFRRWSHFSSFHMSNVYARIGAALFVIWGILHIWVPFGVFEAFANGGTNGAWKMFTGGELAPHSALKLTSDPVTLYAQAGVLKNFGLDVGGYGVLGLFVAYGLWTKASVFSYLLGVIVIGIADLSFLYFQVFPAKIIELKFEVILGPLVWFLAVIITPFGLFKKNQSKVKSN